MPERPPVQRIEDRPAAGRDDGTGCGAGLEPRPSTPRRERPARRGGGCSRRSALRAAPRTASSVSTKGRPQPLGHQPSDRRLAAGRHADQHDAGSRRQTSAPGPSSARSASRMTSTGAARSVHSEKLNTAWRSSIPAPPRARAPAARASRTRRVGLGAVHEVEDRHLAPQEVGRHRRLVRVGADRRRVDEQVRGHQRAGHVRPSALDRPPPPPRSRRPSARRPRPATPRRRRGRPRD